MQRLLEEAQSAELTYQPVGRTLAGSLPPGYHHLEAQRTIPPGADWDTARSALREWAGHRSVSAMFQPDVPELANGESLVFAVRVLGLWVTVTCRIVGVIDEADRFGFAYGTLPYHPEAGEECFRVARNADDSVTISILAYSRPGDRITSLLGPAGRRIQRMMTRRYIDGLVSAARRAVPG